MSLLSAAEDLEGEEARIMDGRTRRDGTVQVVALSNVKRSHM
jgi:hypothetical protein